MPLLITLESTLVGPKGRPILGPDGEPVDRILKPVNSWVKQFPQILKMSMQHIDELGVLDTSNVSQTITHDPVPQMEADAAAGNDSFGVLVGTSTTAPTSTDVALNAKIAAGAGAGQLDYQAVLTNAGLSPISITGGFRVPLSRQVDNNSGGGITVEEIGLVVEHRILAGTAFFLILHDLITSVIPDGTSRVFTYNLDFLV